MKSTGKKALFCLPVLIVSQGLMAQQKPAKPNVVFILADDLGWNDLSCMGSKFYETPHIDSMTRRGTLFTNGYAACQVSSPSRASILTGQYTPRHKVTDWIGEAYGANWRRLNRHNKLLPAPYSLKLPASEYTIADCLRAHGYTTFIAGKWHLGGKGSLPEDHGFDINVGGWQAGSPVGGYFSPYHNPNLKDGPKGENLSMRLAKETVKFMTSQKQKDKPFFVYLAFYAVHAPIQTSEARWKRFQEKAKAMGIQKRGFEFDRTQPVRTVQDNPVYAGLIGQMDDAVGVVLQSLKKLGLDKNTIVIFTSDNGGVVSGDDFSTCLFPLRGGKGRQWEGGIRVPVIIDDPFIKQAEKPKVSNVPVCGIDYYPTILDMLGIKKPRKQKIDGVSILPLLEGDSIKHRPLFWHYPHYGNQGGEPSSIVRDGDWKLIYYHADHHCELYNLRIDLGEHEPLNAQYPGKVKQLKAELFKWLKKIKAKMPAADPLYNPKAEAQVKYNWKYVRMPRLEKARLNMLKDDWKPNKTWWDSKITQD